MSEREVPDLGVQRCEALAVRIDKMLDNEKAADVVFALGILIGRAVAGAPETTTLAETLVNLGHIAQTEIDEIAARPRPHT